MKGCYQKKVGCLNFGERQVIWSHFVITIRCMDADLLDAILKVADVALDNGDFSHDGSCESKL